VTTVLVVEDHDISRSLLRDLLELWGYAVLEAEGVEDAWAILGRERLDLVVMDIRIPGGGGELLLERMKNDETLRTLPVLAVTAHAMRGDRERFLGLGFDEYLPKPIDTSTFPGVVARCLQGKKT
jgi:CheY-like chemotaxis protein